MLVTPNGFAILTSMLSTLAGGKIVLALEVRSFFSSSHDFLMGLGTDGVCVKGGYNVESIATSALSCVKVLLGDEPAHLPSSSFTSIYHPPCASISAVETVQKVLEVQRRYWNCFGPKLESINELKESGGATMNLARTSPPPPPRGRFSVMRMS